MDDLQQLERQVERSQLFTHTVLSEQASRILEIEAFLYGLIDLLVEKGVTPPDALKRAASEVRREMDAKQEDTLPLMALRVDHDDQTVPRREVNCAERMPICHAVCCRLDFALDRREIESGRIKWDLGRPYFIRQDSNRRCCHNDRGSGTCGVYADRPLVCRQYSCDQDPRIWKDFDRMELNQEWIDRYLQEGSSPRLLVALMHPPQQLIQLSPARSTPSSDAAAPGRTERLPDLPPSSEPQIR